ncbi:CPBP family intramembrane glutamic endopeptidase [Leucobacter sp. NPDC058333]|uniref:CPBP family intramembrane glutamic endopeptidase n=1 Tax=Leucobacter sp. NPDC058333 TaxID=3346450 RepID=UPI003649D7C9
MTIEQRPQSQTGIGDRETAVPGLPPTEDTPLAPVLPQTLSRVPWGAVAIFVVIAFGLAWVAVLPLWRMDTNAPEFPGMIGLFAAIMMFTPAVATLAALFLAKTPKTARLQFLGMWPLRPAKRVVWSIIAAIFAPLVIVIVSIGVAVLFGWARLDLVTFSGFQEMLDAQLAALGGETADIARASMPPIGVLVALQFAMVPIGAVVNSVLAFGEEIGWRGWLLPALRPLGTWPALLITGAIWGLWHSPIILLGYNFGLTDWRGVALMTIGCIAWGTLLGWARLRTGSVWPAVFGHGALNASAAMIAVLAAAGAPLDPALAMPLGACGWIAVAVVVVLLVVTGHFAPARQLPLAATVRRRGA